VIEHLYLAHFSDYVDLYCERTGWGLWNEPINVISNFAFLIASISAYISYSKIQKNMMILIAIIMTLIVGIGSSTFHVFAQNWALWVDVIPILVTILFIVYLIMYNVFNRPILLSSLIAVLVMLFTLYFELNFSMNLNGSAPYLPALITLIEISVESLFNRRIFLWYSVSATALFMLSLVVRSNDLTICDVFPLGIHFIWHILNAGVLYLLLKGIVEVEKRKGRFR
jgi:hypothetical protein